MGAPKQPATLTWENDRQCWAVRYECAKTGRRLRHRTGFGRADRRKAEAERSRILAEQGRIADDLRAVTPDHDDPTNSNPKLVSVAAVLAFYGHLQEGTPNAGLAGQHITNLLRHWAGKTLLQVNKTTCRQYVEKRTQDTYSPPKSRTVKHVGVSTAARELGTLSAAIKDWHEEYTLTALPVVKKPQIDDAHNDWLTEAEYLRLLKAAQGYSWIATDVATREPIWERTPGWHLEIEKASDHLERFCEIGFYSGSRADDILGLGWSFALDHGWVDIESRILNRSGPRELKTRKRAPACRIHDRLLPKFLAWRTADRERKIDWVVHEQGAPLARVSKGFLGAAKRACLDRRDIDGYLRVGNADPNDDLGWPTPHILRHTRATLMLRAGVPPHEVGEYLGMSLKMVLDRYGHHHTEYQQRAAAA